MNNTALEKWRKGEFSLGAWINLPDLHVAETLARMDVDWLCFDLQHGLLSHSHLLALLPAIGATKVTPLARVAGNSADQIGRVLDAGAHGVIVPMVNNAEEARRAVEACRYPPQGNRSCGPMRGLLTDGMQYLFTANSQIACIAMIETAEGLENVEAIAATPGLDALFIGPIDLCFGLGVTPGDFADQRYIDATARIVGAAKDAGIAVGLFGYTAGLAHQASQQGFQFASAGTDIAFLRQGASLALATAQGLSPEDAKAARPGY